MEQQPSLLPETTTEQASPPEEAAKSKLRMEDRIDILDYIRGQQSPIMAETKVQAADIVSKATGIEITPSQLDYLISSLPKHYLASKFAIGNTNEIKLAKQIADLEDYVKNLSKRMGVLVASVNESADRATARFDDLTKLEANVNKLMEAYLTDLKQRT